MLTRHAARTSAATQDETGAVLVLFALFMSIAILFSSFVLDVGRWFENQRHLQLQADAAAFAAAGAFEYPCTPKIEAAIYKAAGRYGGAASVLTPGGTVATKETLFNTQVDEEKEDNQSNVHEEVNKKAYFNQSLKGNSSETSTVEQAPCSPEASMIDVKLTETHVPVLFKLIGADPSINAHARISIRKESQATAVEPLIESEPEEVRVFYVNDATCGGASCKDGNDGNYEQQQLASGLLTRLKGEGFNEEHGTVAWTDASAPVPVNITAEHIGVRIALAGKVGALKGSGNETVAVCHHEYVECFDEDDGVIPPLLNISGYSAEGEGTGKPFAPVVHKVLLETPSPDTCTDGYFSNYHAKAKGETCSLTISAAVQYGNGSESATGIKVVPQIVYTEGFTNKKHEPVEQEPLKLTKRFWTGVIHLPSWYYGNYGSTAINLVVTCEPKVVNSPCEKQSTGKTVFSFEDVQRAYTSGPDGSNRIVAAKVFEPSAGGGVPGETGADAYERCEKADGEQCEHKLAVTIELTGSLEDAKKFSNKEGQPIPPFRIPFGDNDQEDDDQFVVTCPPTTSSAEVVAKYEAALAHGCEGKYSTNSHGGSCSGEKAAQEQIEKEETTETKGREAEEQARLEREANEKAEGEKWEKETKITKKQKGEKEAAQTTARKARETTEALEQKEWEEEEEGRKPPKITKKQKEEKVTAQTAARVTREHEENVARETWGKEEKELKVTKAEREAKEAAQKVARESAEKTEATARAAREAQEKATKEAKERLENAARECVGLVSAQNAFSSKHPRDEIELSAAFQNYLAKRIERPVNGLREYCPNNWVNNNEGGVPIIPANDSRLVQLFVVPFTVTDFERKGEVSPLVPIVNFATFYVTGWANGNTEAGQINSSKPEWNPKERRDECSERLFRKLPKAQQEELENEATPLKEREKKEKEKGFDDDAEQPREIVGHLIKYVNVLGEPTGTAKCEAAEVETCEAVLTE